MFGGVVSNYEQHAHPLGDRQAGTLWLLSGRSCAREIDVGNTFKRRSRPGMFASCMPLSPGPAVVQLLTGFIGSRSRAPRQPVDIAVPPFTAGPVYRVNELESMFTAMEIVREARMLEKGIPVEVEQDSRSQEPRLRFKINGCAPVRTVQAALPANTLSPRRPDSASTVPATPTGGIKTKPPSSRPVGAPANHPSGKTTILSDKPSSNPTLSCSSTPVKFRAGGHGPPTNYGKGSSQGNPLGRTPPPSKSSNAAGSAERPKLRLAIPSQTSA